MLKKLGILLLVPILGCAASPEAVYLHSKDKVVKLGMVMDNHFKASCSGAFIDSNGTVLTAAHCVSDPHMIKLFVKLEDESYYRAEVLKVDSKHDLAIIKVEVPMYRTPYFRLGDDGVRGQEILAFGSPMGLQHSVSIGWVENIVDKDMTYILHGAAILPGSSGGPLVDLHGRLIGVNTAMLMLNMFSVAPGYYVAVDVEEIKAFLAEKR